MSRAILLSLCCLLPAPVLAKNLWQTGQASHVEVEYRQGKTLGQSSNFTGFNLMFNGGGVKGGTVSIAVMNNDVERNRGGVFESIKNFAYGGARFRYLYRTGTQQFAELYAVVGLGTMEYRRVELNSSAYSSGAVAVLQPGVRYYWQMKPLAVGVGISAISASAGNGVEGGPHGDLAIRINW